MSGRRELGGLACPHCGKVGHLSWDYASRSVRCSACFVSGIVAPSKPTTQAVEAAAPSEGGGVAKDVYLDRSGQRVTVSYVCPLDDAPPELYVSLPMCEFVRWRLADVIANERRYGRDELRKRGFRVTERQRVEGRMLKLLEQG